VPATGHALGTAREATSSPTRTVPPDDSVAEAARRLTGHAIGSVVVVEGSPAGIATESDRLAVVARGGEPAAVPVGAVMSEPVVTVHPGARLSTAAARMDDHGIRHLVVVDGGPAGVPTTTDIVAAVGPNTAAIVEGLGSAG
jgi:CBS domain-containing protein